MTPAQRIVIQLEDEVGVPPLTQAQIDRLMDILREEFRQAEERGRNWGLLDAAEICTAWAAEVSPEFAPTARTTALQLREKIRKARR
jgi:hypothetical protein